MVVDNDVKIGKLDLEPRIDVNPKILHHVEGSSLAGEKLTECGEEIKNEVSKEEGKHLGETDKREKRKDK
jgi:hypothetical protein